ncbi:MAG TPA: hypothetical protein VF267_10330, partial [Gammaproteobacteria bacterium]
PAACGERLHVLFGVTHDHPALHSLQVNVVFANENDEVVLRMKPAFMTQAPVTPPWVLQALLPECVYWYERQIDDLPTAWHSLNVRFGSSAAMPGPHDLPPRFRFHCVLAHGTSGTRGSRVVDLRHCGPYALGTAQGDA